jgi:O-antigen ligase
VSWRSLGEILTLGTLWVAPLLVRGERAVRRLVDGTVIVISLAALEGMAQLLADAGQLDLDRRIRGPFSHYMTFSGVLLICDLLLLATLAWNPERRRSGWRWIALVLLNLGLVGTLTRGAWIALALTLPLLLALRRPRFLLAGLPVAVLLAALAPVPVVRRALSIFDLRDASSYDRLCMLDAGLAMVRERPLFGLGPDQVKERYAIYRHPTAPRYTVPHLHDTVLQLAAERGLTGAAAYLWLMGAAIALAWRRYRAEGGATGPRADLYLGSLLALLAFNVAGLFENNWGDAEVQRLTLFLLAIPVCLPDYCPTQRTRPSSTPL